MKRKVWISLQRKIIRILLLLFLFYVFFKVLSCYKYGPIVFGTFRPTPWSLFKVTRSNLWSEKGRVELLNFIYRLDGYIPSCWKVEIGEVRLSSAEREQLYIMVQQLLTDPKPQYETIPISSGIEITFIEEDEEDGVRVKFVITKEGFYISYWFENYVWPYPTIICCGPHTKETQNLWNRYGDINHYLPLSEKVRAKLRDERKYNPRRLNVLDESLLESPIWEPEMGVLEK